VIFSFFSSLIFLTIACNPGDRKEEIREKLISLANPTPLEDFNTNAILLDVDGNSWSDR